MRQRRFESESGPATLGSTARAHLILHVWCKDCRRRVDVDPGEQAERHGADMTVPDWAARLACSACGSRNVDFVVTPASTGGVGNPMSEISETTGAGPSERGNLNIYEMFVAHGGPGFWVRRTTWAATCARVAMVGPFTAPGPYFGNPSVLAEVYSLSGKKKAAVAPLPAPGTYKTWRQIDAPPWASTIKLRPLNDPWKRTR